MLPISLNVFMPSFSTYVNISNTIFEIPKEIIKKYVKLDLRIPPISNDHIKIIREADFEELHSYYKGIAENLTESTYNFHASYVWLKNVYCNRNASYCSENFTFIKLDDSGNSWIREPLNGPVPYAFENIILLGHDRIFQFGHFFSDILIPLLMFPQEIISKSYLPLGKNTRRHLHYLKYIDFLPEKVILLDKGQWIYAQNLYTPIDPLVHIAHYGKLSYTFAKKLRNYFKVNDLVPDKYYITNRGQRQFRHISNMGDVLNAFQNKYPERKFTVLRDINNFNVAAYYWASAKLIFGPTGSNLFKHYIMADKTVLAIIASDHFDAAIAAGAESHDVYTIFYRLVGMPQFGHHVNILNITDAINVIDIAIYFLDNGHFKSNVDI